MYSLRPQNKDAPIESYQTFVSVTDAYSQSINQSVLISGT